MNFFTVDPDITWRFNAYADLVALDGQYRDRHVIADDEFLTNSS